MDVLLDQCPHYLEFDAFIKHLESGLQASPQALRLLRNPYACNRSDQCLNGAGYTDGCAKGPGQAQGDVKYTV